MSGAGGISEELLEAAADWYLRVRAARAESEVHAAWLNWIEANPAHRAAFAEIQETWDIVGKLESPPWPRAEELAVPLDRRSLQLTPELQAVEPALPADASPYLSPSLRVNSSGLRRRFRSPRRRWALAASIIIGVGALVIAGLKVNSYRLDNELNVHKRISTGRGEQQAAVLPDGSRIELGGFTGVEVAFTPERRLVIADEGEVFYKIERDSTRPFVVQAGPVQVKAIGTAFSVRREGETVAVVVTEGMVEVKADAVPTISKPLQAVRAKAGERVRFDGGQLAALAQPAYAEPAGPWRRGHLRFEEEPLRVVVASLNRYTARPIVIADAELQELRFTGTVFDDSVEDWLEGVQAVLPVTVDTGDPARVVLERRK